jgi:hypothetical protein
VHRNIFNSKGNTMTTSARNTSTTPKLEELARIARQAEVERARVMGELIATGIYRVAASIRGFFSFGRRAYS